MYFPTAAAAAPMRAVGMAAPVVQVLWVTSGLCSGVWALTSDAVPMNKSDSNIKRNAVFIVSLLYESYLKSRAAQIRGIPLGQKTRPDGAPTTASADKSARWVDAPLELRGDASREPVQNALVGSGSTASDFQEFVAPS